MAEIKRMTDEEFDDIASTLKFDRVKLTKDYIITVLLYLLKDVEGIYFKGGTALQKIFLDHSRLSEDIDFTITKEVRIVKNEINSIIEKSKMFDGTSEDKDVEGFLRIVVNYTSFDGLRDKVFIDLNKRAKIMLRPEKHEVKHYYQPHIPAFLINTLARDEIIAEKLAAAIGRNKPRDHFDVYKIIHAELPINIELTKKKCEDSGAEFSIIKMFNKAKVLKKRWDKDLASLISEPLSFQEIMHALAEHFRLKSEKMKLRKKS